MYRYRKSVEHTLYVVLMQMVCAQYLSVVNLFRRYSIEKNNVYQIEAVDTPQILATAKTVKDPIRSADMVGGRLK